MREIEQIDNACYGGNGTGYSSKELEEMKAEHSIVILLKENGKTIGYSYARPVGNIWSERNTETDTVNISSTAILPDHQNRGLVQPLNVRMEQELRQRGYSYMERNADENNGYADSIAKAYFDRIVESKRNIPASRDGDGQKGYFKIQL